MLARLSPPKVDEGGDEELEFMFKIHDLGCKKYNVLECEVQTKGNIFLIFSLAIFIFLHKYIYDLNMKWVIGENANKMRK